ncbi:proposed homoserine kinase [Ammonifex degensii KC4]|uniref:Proposed homoserine kinase n=1 Tax=Ammonifex degensii (strain DSM 10501 / KC4) TaxID=429009 RepID=C9RAS7_AMMDK|nr:cofactor-independent phosphoglycerate mutase [Ammonifex degensii]ACX51354.1 proposed homoserine kinase [Ammonifex degensii KC4]
MKYAVILADGMADYPCSSLGGLTPLAYARTPNLDALARTGLVGEVRTVPPDFPPGSDVANLAVLGYDPRRYYTGRAPLEAASQGIELSPADLALRCNLVTLSPAEEYADRVMLDYSAGEIPTERAGELIAFLQERLGDSHIQFYPGVSYRHLMVWREGPDPDKLKLTPPHDITGQRIGPYLPQGEGAELLRELMVRGAALLASLPRDNTANAIWFWGAGRRPQLPLFRERFGLTGAVVAAVDLIKGIGRLCGMRVPLVPGATGNTRTDYRAKAQAALKELHEGADFVFVHIEAPDEAGHQGDLEEKIRAIESIDRLVVGEILKGLRESFPSWRLLILPDHPTPVVCRTHTSDPVPFLAAGDPPLPGSGEGRPFTEEAAASSSFKLEEGHRLLPWLLGKEAGN